MTRWRGLLADTLFKRLFLLMWVALVASHLLAWTIVTGWIDVGPGLPLPGIAPTFPSLPPTPGLGGPPAGPGPGGPPPPGAGAAWRGSEPGPHGAGAGVPELAMPLLLLDYGVRLLVIGLMAWWGARWLAAPMRRLADAATALRGALGRDLAPPTLDETGGTVEVRRTAQVFNEMAGALDEQFRARGLMAAAISHDLRTPLTRMRLRLETMEPGDATATQKCIADLREMNELIDASLQLFRDAGHAEGAQRLDVLALVQALADDHAELGHAVSVDGPVAIVSAQPVALRRALANLIGNAVRYGTRAEVRIEPEAQQVHVVIDDHGPGIPPPQLDAVFRPFYRLEGSRHRDTGGTGLGLYIAKDLLAKQGATLTLSNRPEGGLRATVTLPRG